MRGGGVRSASPSEALMPVSNHWRVKDDVRFGSKADVRHGVRFGPLRATNGHRYLARIPRSHHRRARARARHLAPVPQGGGVNRRAILHERS